jgi:hypothetical protein
MVVLALTVDPARVFAPFLSMVLFLLVHVQTRARIIAIAATFLIVSAGVYYLFGTAWLWRPLRSILRMPTVSRPLPAPSPICRRHQSRRRALHGRPARPLHPGPRFVSSRVGGRIMQLIREAVLAALGAALLLRRIG